MTQTPPPAVASTKRTCENNGHLRARGNYCVFCHELVKPTESEEKWNSFYEGIPKDIISKMSIHDLHRIGKVIKEVWNVE